MLLPAGPFAALRPEEQRMALCHELVHLQRRDLWLAYIPALAERLFFFHPLVAPRRPGIPVDEGGGLRRCGHPDARRTARRLRALASGARRLAPADPPGCRRVSLFVFET